jgi:hypothetical protein
MADSVTTILGVAIVGLLALTGWGIAGWLDFRSTPCERAALAFPLGGAVTSLVFFLLSWAGVPLTAAVAWAALGIVPASVLARRLTMRSNGGGAGSGGMRLPARTGGRSLLRAIPGVAAILVVLLALVLSIGNAYAVWDSADIWASKGYGIALEGSIFAAQEWGKHGLAYPLNIPIQISLFELLGGDLAPASKLVFTAYFASLLLGCHAFLRRAGASRPLAGLCALLLATTPVVFYQGTVGYANLPMASYVVLGTFLAVQAVRHDDRRALLLSGSLFGFAAWTRIEGALLGACAIGALALTFRSLRRNPLKLLMWVGSSAVVSLPWLVFFVIFGRANSQAMGAVAESWTAIGNDDLHIGAITTILGFARRTLLNIENWGILVPLAVALLAMGWRELRRGSQSDAVILLGVSAATGLGAGMLFYVGSWVTRGLFGWLQRGFDREILAPATLLLVAGFVAILPTITPAHASPSSRESDGGQ